MIDILGLQAAPSHLESINFHALTPYQRVLLMLDGSVTKFLEAYMMEPIEVVRLNQETRPLSTKQILLEAPKGTDVIVRQALLQGKRSHLLYALAASLIVPDRLPDIMRRGLEVDSEGLGHLLIRSRLETRREILWSGMERVRELPDVIGCLSDSYLLNRTYRIIARGQPIILINEKFPYDAENYHLTIGNRFADLPNQCNAREV